MNTRKNQNGGFIKFIVLVIVVLVVLAYLGYDVKSIINSPIVVKVLTLTWGVVVLLFNLLVSIIKVSWGTVTEVLQYLIKFVQTLKPN